MQRLVGWSGPTLVRGPSRGVTHARALASAARPQMVGPESRETIFAVSSGQGVRCGVTVIRVSGRSARIALERMTPRGRRDPTLAWLVPRAATLTQLLEPAVEGAAAAAASGAADERLDSALVLWFPAPRSFTGEDVAELHVHGGRATVAAVLAALGRLPDFRLAERGEYSRRAFANGRMDLTEAEGLADLLAANTDAQRRQALAQMGGAARARLDGWRAELLDCLAHTEVRAVGGRGGGGGRGWAGASGQAVLPCVGSGGLACVLPFRRSHPIDR
jgi:tRNA modification GTPase